MRLKRASHIGLILAAVLLTVIVSRATWAEEEKKDDLSISQTTATPDTATIIGVVKFEGDAPFRRAINFGANLDCKRMHEGKATVHLKVQDAKKNVTVATRTIRLQIIGDRRLLVLLVRLILPDTGLNQGWMEKADL